MGFKKFLVYVFVKEEMKSLTGEGWFQVVWLRTKRALGGHRQGRFRTRMSWHISGLDDVNSCHL